MTNDADIKARHTTVAETVDALSRNAAAYYDHSITYEEMDRRQRALWRAAEADATVLADVMGMLNGGLTA